MNEAERALAQKEVDAFDTLLKSEKFGEECENANYHSTHDWLDECKREREAELNGA